MKLKPNHHLALIAAALFAASFTHSVSAQSLENDSSLIIGDVPPEYSQFYFNTVIVGKGNRPAAGEIENSNLSYSTVVGSDNQVANGSTVFGTGNRQSKSSSDEDSAIQSVQVGRGNSLEGMRNQQVGDFNTTTGNFNKSFGDYNNVSGDYNSVIGTMSRVEGSYNSVLSTYAKVNANQTTVVGYAAEAHADGCVAVGSGAVCRSEQEFSVGSASYQRRISNVRAGGQNSDAATVGQLRQLAGGIGGGADFNSFGSFYRPTINFLSGAVYDNTVDGLYDLDNRVWMLENDAGSGPGTPGETGPRGADGRSAYEVAISNGFQGDEQSWLASLKGADGRDGVGGSNVVAGSNIEVVEQEDGTRSVSLSDNVELSAQGKLAVGATTVNNSGVSIQGGPSMTANGIDAAGRQITNVAPGTIAQGSMDAINGGQLWDLENRLNDRWEDTNRQIERMGAQSAALAMMAGSSTYQPVGKVALQAGVGMYGNSAAFAVGAKARLSERSSLSIGFSYNGGKAMGGVGYSVVID